MWSKEEVSVSHRAVFSQNFTGNKVTYYCRRRSDSIGQIQKERRGPAVIAGFSPPLALHTPYQALHHEAAVHFHIHTTLPGALHCQIPYRDRWEPHLLLMGSTGRFLLATGGSHGATDISPPALPCERFSETVFDCCGDNQLCRW